MASYSPDDTIAAIASGVGEGGIGIIRISGNSALSIADKVFSSRDNGKPSGFKTYTTHYGWIKEGLKVIDEVILTVMRAPKSYTREDIVEINCHGGIIPLRDCLELVLKKGARLAEPGEFTKRAFLSGRIDLAQAEAVLDIIRAKTDSALRIGLGQLAGGLSAELNKIREGLISLLSILEANIDFPDDAAGIDSKDIRGRLLSLNKGLKEMLRGAKFGRVLREGIHVVICGRPNVGKSSLLNALLRQERSIVTPVAGTTRDTIEEIIDIRGIPVRIVDTAGILEPRDLVEKKAVARSRKYIRQADLVILLFDASKKLSREDVLLMRRLENKTVIAVINKIDLKENVEKGRITKAFERTIEISAKKGRNINLLEEAVAELVYAGRVTAQEPFIISNLRHIERVRQAQKLLEAAIDSLDNSLSSEFIAQDVKGSLGFLDEIVGKRFSEDLLVKIFSEFCIGK